MMEWVSNEVGDWLTDLTMLDLNLDFINRVSKRITAGLRNLQERISQDTLVQCDSTKQVTNENSK